MPPRAPPRDHREEAPPGASHRDRGSERQRSRRETGPKTSAAALARRAKRPPASPASGSQPALPRQRSPNRHAGARECGLDLVAGGKEPETRVLDRRGGNPARLQVVAAPPAPLAHELAPAKRVDLLKKARPCGRGAPGARAAKDRCRRIGQLPDGSHEVSAAGHDPVIHVGGSQSRLAAVNEEPRGADPCATTRWARTPRDACVCVCVCSSFVATHPFESRRQPNSGKA
jgi:hypothetical protein